MKVVGMRKFEYTSKKTGSTYPAANIYVTEERKGVTGMAAFDMFVKADIVPDDLTVGSEIRCFYNRYGGVEAITLL